MRKNWLLLLAILAVTKVFSQYTVNGYATQISCNEYRLTQAANNQNGSVWNNNKIDLTQSFDYKFDFFLGSNNSPGADGIAFVLQPISTSVGSAGGGLGYQGVAPAVGVTLDTYTNGSDNDPLFDHIAVQLNGDLKHNTSNNIAGPVQMVTGVDNMEDGQWHALRVVWDAVAQQLTVYVDGELRLTTTKNFVADVFGGNPLVFWGFTGSTGGENNYQAFRTALNPAYYSLAGQKRCINEPITFKDSTVSFTTIAKFYWDFGDGSPIDSVNLSPVHIYTSPGDYTVKQRVIGADGCEAINQQPVRIGVKPISFFKVVKDSCLSKPVRFFDSTQISFGAVEKWLWDFDNGGQTSTLQNPVTTYTTYGYKNVTLKTVSFEGCESDVFSRTVKVKTAVTNFTFTDSVCMGKPLAFSGTYTILPDGNPEWYNWVFENVPAFSNNLNPSYTFSNPGVNGAIFILLYGGYRTSTNLYEYCQSVTSKSVYVIPKPVAWFKNSNICQDAAVVLTDSSYSPATLAISNWWWNLGNGNFSNQQNPVTVYTALKDTVALVVTDAKGCLSDTLKQPILINPKPVAKFGISNLLCQGQLIQFSDSSAAIGSTVTKWSWIYNNAEWSTQQNDSKIFAAGNQTVALVATSALGCKSDTTYKTFYVNAKPAVTIDFKDACKFAPVNFVATDNSGTVTQWNWLFGDGGVAVTQNAQHTYTANGSYTVKLYALANTGCFADTLKKDIVIYGTNAFAGNDTIVAAGQPLQLQATGGLSYTWSPANVLNNASLANPVAILNSTQIFTLKAFTPEGCESYDDVLVKVYNGPDIYLPNAFTPNGDGRNDSFRGIPVGIQQFDYLKIFNRWGQLVFYTTDHRKGWDGYWKAQSQPGGVYVVLAKGKDYKGNTVEKKGTVLLIR